MIMMMTQIPLNQLTDEIATPTDTIRLGYIDEAGNFSGHVDGAIQGVQALADFFIDSKRPALDAAKMDTIVPVSNDTITDGTRNAGFPSDTNTVIFKLAEPLDSLFVNFDGANVDVSFVIPNTDVPGTVPSTEDDVLKQGIDYEGLGSVQDRILDFTALGNKGPADDMIFVHYIHEDDGITQLAEYTADSREGQGNLAKVGYKLSAGFKDSAIQTGMHTLKLKAQDLGGNVGDELVRENVYVDVDELKFVRLFPTSAGFGAKEGKARVDTLEEETAKLSFTLSEPADSVLITYTGLEGPDEENTRTRRLSGSELTRTDGAQLIVVDSLMHGTLYHLKVLGRDIAGNFSQAGPDTFLYDTTHAVPTITRFTVAAETPKEDADAVAVGLDKDKAVKAGEKVTLTLTADATTDGSRAAVTYRQEAILKVSVDGSDAATTGIALEGTGVTDMGGGRAMLSALDWVVGARSVTLTDTAAIETLSVSIIDSASADGPFAGALDSSIVITTDVFSQIVVSVPDTVTQGEDFWVSIGLGDQFANPRLADNRYVSISANKLGVQVPMGEHLISGGQGGFPVNSGTFAGGGLVITVRDIVSSISGTNDPTKERAGTGDDFVGGKSVAIYVQTPGEVIVGTTVDRPDTLIVEDYMGADGAGDQGGFLVLTWDLSDNHTPGGAYRIYREVHVNYAPAGDDDTTGAAVVELDSPAAVPLPWAKIDMVPKEDIARAIVATLDNVASMWWVAAEVGGATSAKHAFADVASFMSPAGLMDEPMVPGIASRAPVARVASPYELMAEAMVASKQAGLVDPDAPVFATLTPEALAYAETGVGLRLKDTGGDVQSSALTPSAEAVAAIDNIPPEPITNLRVMDTPGDAGASIDVVWTKSSSDRLVPRSASGAIGLEAVSDIVPGVVGYNVYRKLSGGEFTPVGMTDAGVTTLSDVTALNGVRYTYQVSSFDLRQ